MNIGIIGTGTIATAIVTGFNLNKQPLHTFFLSPRNAEKSALLAEKYDNCHVCASNQEVLNKSEWIFITLQSGAFDALEALNFSPHHKVLNMAAEMDLNILRNITGNTAILAHVIPLPMIALGFGPLLIYPEIHEVGALFQDIADPFYAKDKQDTQSMQLVTCLMSAYYMMLGEIIQFTDAQNLDKTQAIAFTHSMFSSLTKRAMLTEHCDMTELAHDMTPGGYNEQAMNELVHSGAIAQWGKTLNSLNNRLIKSKK